MGYSYFLDKQKKIQDHFVKLENQKNSRIPCYIDFELESHYVTLKYKKIGFFKYGFDFKKKKAEKNIPYNIFFVLKKIYKNEKGKYVLEGIIENIFDSSKKLIVHKLDEETVNFSYGKIGDIVKLIFQNKYEVNISNDFGNGKDKKTFYWGYKNNKLGGYERKYKGDIFEIYFEG